MDGEGYHKSFLFSMNLMQIVSGVLGLEGGGSEGVFAERQLSLSKIKSNVPFQRFNLLGHHNIPKPFQSTIQIVPKRGNMVIF